MKWALEIISGEGAGRKINLGEDEIRIGRSEDSGILIREQTVSKNHARILRSGSGFAVEDLGSINGTAVNGDKVGRKLLENGDEITVGGTVIRFLAERGGESKITPAIFAVIASLIAVVLLALYATGGISAKKSGKDIYDEPDKDDAVPVKMEKGYKYVVIRNKNRRCTAGEAATAETVFNQGVGKYRQGDVAGAVRLWEKSLSINPNNAKGIRTLDSIVKQHFDRGRRFYLERKFYRGYEGKLVDSISEWKVAVAIDPSHAQSVYKLKKAKEELELIIRKRYDDANRYFRNHLYENAITEYGIVLKLIEKDDRLLLNERKYIGVNLKLAKEKVKRN